MIRPKVSVITSFYNAEKYAVRSIGSVLKQNMSDLELIIVDDCSTDTTRSIIKNFAEKDPRVKPIYLDSKLDKKLPLIANLNLAWDMAQGEYIARIDHDDFWALDKLRKQIIFLDEHPNVYLLGTSVELISEDGKIQGYHLPVTETAKATRELQSQNIIYNSTSVFRNSGKYRYRLPYAEDYDLWLQFIKDGHLTANLSEILVQYTLVNNSFSRKSILKPWCGAIIAKRIFRNQIEFSSTDPEKLYRSFRKFEFKIIDIVDLCRFVFLISVKDLIGIVCGRIAPPKTRFPVN